MALESATQPRADQTLELDLDEEQLAAATQALEPASTEVEPITTELEAVTAEGPVVKPGMLEQDELTVRRSFSPKTPPKVAVEISDADATWKWTRPQADQQGVFTGVALPILDGEQALQFDHSEVEVTQQTFALKKDEVPLLLARRREQPKRRPVFVADLTQETVPFKASFLNARALGLAALMIVVAVASALAVQSRLPRIAAIGVAMRAPEESAPAVLEPAPAGDKQTTGTVTATVKGVKVFVDGKLAGDSSNALVTPCGSHVVQVGVSGVARTIAVPCGGNVSVSP